MTTADIKKTAETKMAKSIDALKGDLQKIRTGRAQDDVQKLTDRVVTEIDKLVHAKEAEIMAV